MDKISPNRNNPAANLAGDLLLTIFEFDRMLPLIPDISRSSKTASINWDALLNLRVKSQTCSAWRTLILNSPLLWARAITLNCISKGVDGGADEDSMGSGGGKSDGTRQYVSREERGHILWIKEVLRRTQTAPLWVLGSFSEPTFEDFMINLIKEEWHRIERIVVYLRYSHLYPEFEDIITRPAPFLQQYSFEFGRNQVLTAPPSSIFANHAPFLTTLVVRNFWIDHEASFLSGLRHLVIDLTFSLLRLLKILSKTPLLQYLEINSIEGYQGGELPYVHLLHLARIMPPSFISFSLALLEHITPSPGCSLYLILCGEKFKEFKIEQFNPVINFAKRFLQHHSPRRIELYISTCGWTRFRIKLSSGAAGEGPEFFFEYYGFRSRSPSMKNVVSLLEAFSVQEIACATEFQFQFEWDDRQTPDAAFVKTFAPVLLPSLEVFIVEKKVLSTFFEPYVDRPSVIIGDVFPRLRRIEIKGLETYDIQGNETLKGIWSRLLDKV